MKKAEATRLNILQKSFDLIYAKGYNNASIDDILATTQVTKGAFYYHFKNKDEMGLAIINELMKPALQNSFNESLQGSGNPLDAIYDLMYYLLMEDEFLKVEYGCPAANFSQEMTPWNEDFTKALNKLTQEWIQNIIQLLENNKLKGYIRKDVNAEQVAFFVLSGYWGVRNFGKLTNSKKVYLSYLKELKSYLEMLK